jgi:2-keto-4-pentenoate hydratase
MGEQPSESGAKIDEVLASGEGTNVDLARSHGKEINMTKSELANEIVRARQEARQSDATMPEPSLTLGDAMDIQTIAFERYGEKSVGWKVGATNEAAQKGFGISAPFYGPMAKGSVLKSGDKLKKSANVGAVEPEYAFRMARDYPQGGEAINEETARGAVETVHIAIEVIGRTLSDASFANGVGVTLDFGGNAAFVVGPEISDWANADLAQMPVTAYENGDEVQKGNGTSAMGDPIRSVVWMAQTLAENGGRLKAGEWVSTGTCTPPVPAKAGSIVEAQFGDFGRVSVRFT